MTRSKRSFLSVVSASGLVVGNLLAHALGELVGPRGCAACDARTAGALFCPTCAVSVERATGPAYRATTTSAFEYGGAMATAITRFKYGHRPDLGGPLGRAMLAAAETLGGTVDVVIPVPLHPKRLAERGYNQSALLAAPVARALKVPLLPRALVRLHDTPRQAVLDRAERRENVKDCFATSPGARIEGARVLLVDDVRTTGATLDACSAALRAAAARQVSALVLARRS